jgi:hypothetical protein
MRNLSVILSTEIGELEFHTYSRTRSSNAFASYFFIHKQRGKKKKKEIREGFLKIRVGSILFRIEKKEKKNVLLRNVFFRRKSI